MQVSLKDRIKKGLLFGISMTAFMFVANNAYAYAEPAPKITIDAYEISEGRAAADETFIFSCKIKNVSSTTDANDVLVTFNNSENYIYPSTGETNQKYFATIAKGSSVDAEFKMKVDKAIPVESAPVAFNIVCSYGPDGTFNENNVTTSIDIEPSCTLDIISMAVSDKAYRDGIAYLSFYGKNTGNVDIRDLTINIEGKVDEDDSKINIGNVRYGSTKNQDLSIKINELGSQTLKIGFSYHDEYDNEYTVEPRNYNIEVLDSESESDGESGVGGVLKKLSDSSWQIYVTAGAIICLVMLGILYKRIKSSFLV